MEQDPLLSAREYTFPNVSEEQSTPSETFGTFRKPSERTMYHTLSVREVAKLFEDAGVPRTERSIINWCNPNKRGVVRLDCFFDENENKYFITPQSVERVIKEERQKGNLENYTSLEFSETREEFSERFGNLRKEESAASERFGNFPNISETREFVSETKHTPESWDKESTESEPTRQMKELEKEMFDLKITNRGKDYFIEQLTKRNQELIEQLMQSSHTIGFLEAQVRQLAPPMHEGQGSGEPRVALEQSENNTPNNSSE